MQTSTGAWQALPEIPWATAGASFKDLGVAAGRLLAAIHAALDTTGNVNHALLADQVAGMRAELRNLAKSELVAAKIYSAGRASAPGRHAAPRDHLRLLPDPDRDDDPPARPVRQILVRPHQARP